MIQKKIIELQSASIATSQTESRHRQKDKMDYYSSLDSRFLDSETPTLFELISSQQLDGLLTPSLRYILVYYTQRYPGYLIRVLNKFDELNLVARGTIEYITLKHWNGSFIEKFYGLKRCNQAQYLRNSRIPLEIREAKKRLTKLQLIISLFEIVGVPYLKEKLDIYYDKLYSKQLLNNTTKREALFIKLYPVVKFCLAVSNFICLISLLNGKGSPSVLQWLFNIRYSRLNAYDYDLNDSSKESVNSAKTESIPIVRPPTPSKLLIAVLLRTQSHLRRVLYFVSNKIFPLSIFLLKFLEWWNSSEFVSKLKQQSDPEIDAPKVTPKNKKTYKSTDTCPLCKEPMSNPALLDSGYVFCYTCIHNYLTSQDTQKPARCPVSGELLLNCKPDSDGNWQLDCLRRLMI